MKQAEQKVNGEDLVTLSVKVSRETMDAFREVAEAEYRPMAAELRMLIEGHVKTYRASSHARENKDES